MDKKKLLLSNGIDIIEEHITGSKSFAYHGFENNTIFEVKPFALSPNIIDRINAAPNQGDFQLTGQRIFNQTILKANRIICNPTEN